jgi:hypothetical protein
VLSCGGQPSGRYKTWSARVTITGLPQESEGLRITNFRETERSDTQVTFGWDNNGLVNELWYHLVTSAQPIASDPWPALNSEPTGRLTSTTVDFDVTLPDFGYITLFQLFAVDAEGNVSKPWRATIASQDAPRLQQRVTLASQTATTLTFTVAVADPQPRSNITVTHSITGATVDLSSPQTILAASVTSDITTTGTLTYVVTRGTGNGRITFTASATDRLTDTDAVDIPALDDVPTASISIANNGAPTITASGGAWVSSWVIYSTTSSFPDDASTLSSGAVVNGRHVSYSDPNTLLLAGTLYTTLIPFSGASATGIQGTSIRVSATRHDFTATKTQSISLSNFVAILPNASIAKYDFSNGYLRNVNWGAANVFVFLSYSLVIPDGVTITGISAELYHAVGSEGSINMNLLRVSGTGGETSIANATTSTDGWQTCNASCSESTTGRKYRIQAQLQDAALVPAGCADGDVRASTVSYTYTMPTSDKAI